MKNRSTQLLFIVLCIASFLLLELGTPVPGLSEEYWSGTVTANVNLRKAPSLKGAIIKGLLKGSPVKIYEEQDGWYRVSAQKYHQVFKGWVSIEYVEIAPEAPAVAAPVAEAPEPEPQAQPQPPVEKPAQPAPLIEPEKPLPPPAPVEETVSPEPEPQPLITAEPEPEIQPVEQPPETKVAAPKPEKPPRVEKPPVTEPVATPADDWMHLLPMALPVVAVIVLLIAVVVYRVKRTSKKKTAEPTGPVEWSTPLDANEQALDENLSFEESLRPLGGGLSPSPEGERSKPLGDDLGPLLEEDLREPFEDDLSPSLEEELGEPFEDDLSPSLEEELSEPFEDDLSKPFEDDVSLSPEEDQSEPLEEDLSLALEEDVDEPLEEEPGQPLEEVLSESNDAQLDDTLSDTDNGDEPDSPIRGASVYDQVTEIINRMSDAELTELLDLVNEHQGEKARQDDRLTFYTMVDYVVDGQYYRDFIQDLSVSGVFIKGRLMFEPGQSILMTFMSPYYQKPFKISGEIVRILEDGIGVKFDTESQVQSEALSALIKQISMLEESG